MRAVLPAVLTLAAGGVGACGGDERHASEPPAAGTRAVPASFTRACVRASGRVAVAVLCPARLPAGGFEPPRNFGDAPCTYLINLEPRGMSQRAGAVFHLLFGGTCRGWDLRTRGARWPAHLARAEAADDLRLVGTLGLEPGQSHAEAQRVALRVLRRTRVGSAPALVLRNPPYPAGGIHGGHLSVAWNAGGAGYVVSGHPVAAAASDEDPGPRVLARAARTLVAVAVSMRRPGT